jgi:Resolvase, N terminal domain
MTLPGPTCRIVLAVMVGLHAELSSCSGQSLGIDFHRPLGEPPICPAKQEQHGEPEAVPAIFDHNERVICRGQRPHLGSGAVIGHFSESTDDQDLTLQRTALKGAGCKRVYEEKVSSAKRSRPELSRMLDQLRADDVVVVSRLDRLARCCKMLSRK